MKRLDQLRENVWIALETLRVSTLRSALTILGVVIGVATVMAMAAIIQGLREQIVGTVQVAGPTTFYVMKIFSQTPLNPDQLPKYVRVRPDLTDEEARRIQRLPEIGYASLWAQTLGHLEFHGARTQMLSVYAADDRFSEIMGGELAGGRWFTRAELSSGSPVIVIEERMVHRLFGLELPLGRTMHVLGRPARVIGVYRKQANIFDPPGQEVGAIVPYRMADQQFPLDRTNGLFIAVKPRAGVSAADAQASVMVTLRNMRKLRPAEPNTFDFVTQDQILDLFNKLTGAFFVVMLVLSSVGLLVGGIGVMAIMMVSVTSRTREIGIRKALGATRRDILIQFLVEAATLTGIGGLIGILFGLLFGHLITGIMRIDAGVPGWSAAIAAAVSVSVGLTFGLLPASRAARLDPVEALRYE